MSKKNIMLLFGGESSEHEVSLSSAENVYTAINPEKYNVDLCYIDKSGKWWLVSEVSEKPTDDNSRILVPILGTGEFMTHPGGKLIKPDVIFPVLHGRNGEDGTVQGLTQLMHIPIVGCDVTSSGVAMNKLACKGLLSANGIDIIPYRSHYDYQDIPDYDEIAKELGDTLFVKPARAGSSVGVSKVTSKEQLEHALYEAHSHDSIALIEKALTGKELEVAVLGTPPNHRTSGVGQIVPGDDFYSYDDKYADSSTAQVILDADINSDDKLRIKKSAEKAFEVLGGSGLSRIDYILSDDGSLYLMEVNTLPGFTNISMYPKLWQKEGVEYNELVDRLINEALVKWYNSYNI